MKNFITRNEIKQQADYIICLPYATLERLYRNATKTVYYNSGVYGWNYDCIFHKFLGYNFAIITGYRPFAKVNVSYDYCVQVNNAYKNNIKHLNIYSDLYKLTDSTFDCICSYYLVTTGNATITEKRCAECLKCL